MRHLLFAAGFALAASGAARAEDVPATPETPPPSAPEGPLSADEALRCGAWSAIIVGSNENDEDMQTSYGMAMAYFLGRYEGATGQEFDGPLRDVIAELDRDHDLLAELDQFCPPRMMDFGNRLSRWSEQDDVSPVPQESAAN